MSYSVASILSSVFSEWEERVTGGPKFIDTDHAYIHEGAAFENSMTITASGTTDRIAFTTPAVKYVHFRPSQVFLSKGSVEYSLFENTTSTGAGGLVSTGTYNRNRGSSLTAGAIINTAASSTGGVVIDRWTLWGGAAQGAGRQGAAYSEPLEWVLKRDTEYRIQLNSTEAMTVNMFWYEEDAG